MGKRTASNRLRKLAAFLAEDTAEDLIDRGLHEGLDQIQIELADVTDALAREFFHLTETTSPGTQPAESTA